MAAQPGRSWGLQTPAGCSAPHSTCWVLGQEQGAPGAAVRVGCRQGTHKRGLGSGSTQEPSLNG